MPLARVVASLARGGVTGVLELTEHLGISQAYFLNGTPQGGRTARLQNPLGRLLIRAQVVTEEVLSEALAVHNRTDKLLGQVLLELGAINEETLQTFLVRQSRLNLLSLFALSDAQYTFQEGLVHLTGFTPCPTPPLTAIYEGMRDYAPQRLLAPFLSRLPFAALRLTGSEQMGSPELGAAEQMALRLLSEYRLAGDLARRLPLGERALGALLLALFELGMIELGPALKATY